MVKGTRRHLVRAIAHTQKAISEAESDSGCEPRYIDRVASSLRETIRWIDCLPSEIEALVAEVQNPPEQAAVAPGVETLAESAHVIARDIDGLLGDLHTAVLCIEGELAHDGEERAAGAIKAARELFADLHRETAYLRWHATERRNSP